METMSVAVEIDPKDDAHNKITVALMMVDYMLTDQADNPSVTPTLEVVSILLKSALSQIR
jgi:hypothetical protein